MRRTRTHIRKRQANRLKSDSNSAKEFTMTNGRYDLTEFGWNTIQPLLPNKPRGVPRVDDWRMLNGISYQLRSGSPWDDLLGRYGPYTTVYNRFNRWASKTALDPQKRNTSQAHSGNAAALRIRYAHRTPGELVPTTNRGPLCAPIWGTFVCLLTASDGI